MNKSAVVLIAMALLAAGCATHRSKSNCKGYLDEPGCRDILTVYEDTHNFDRHAYVRRLDEVEAEHNKRRRAQRSKGDSEERSASELFQAPPAQVRPYAVAASGATPLLQPTIPARIWIAPWVDEAGRLHSPGHVYIKAVDASWQYGQEFVRDRAASFPLATHKQ